MQLISALASCLGIYFNIYSVQNIIMPAYQPNSTVSWNTGRGIVSGRVKEVHTSRVEKGEEVKGPLKFRNASHQNPAYVVERDDGSRYLKSESELYTTSEASEPKEEQEFKEPSGARGVPGLEDEGSARELPDTDERYENEQDEAVDREDRRLEYEEEE